MAVRAVSNYQLTLLQLLPLIPPSNGENGVGKLLARLAPIPAPAIEEKLLLPDGCVVARLTFSE